MQIIETKWTKIVNFQVVIMLVIISLATKDIQILFAMPTPVHCAFSFSITPDITGSNGWDKYREKRIRP